MKLSRMLAIGAATALVGVSTLVVAGPASAADTYVADIQTAPGWTLSGIGTATDSPSGLQLDATAGFISIEGAAASSSLSGFVASLDANMTGDARFQIHLNTDGAAGTGATTLTALTVGTAGLDSAVMWSTLNAFETIPAGDSRTIAQYEAELATAGVTPGIVGYGLSAFSPQTATVISITVAADTTWFLPAAPTATITPATLTIAAMGTTGVSGVFSGFVPGEVVTAGIGYGGFGNTIPGAFTADANGLVTIPYSEAGLIPGSHYSLGVIGSVSGVRIAASFTITANPAVLAATGADFTPAIVTGGALLLLGAGLLLVGHHRKAALRG